MKPRGYAKDSISGGPRFEPCENVFCLFFVSFLLLFSFAFLVWKFDVLFVGLLVVFSLMVTVNRRGRYYYLIYIIVHGVQSVTLIIGFIPGQRIIFTLCDRRSEGVVPANTLKRLVRKRKYKNIFSLKVGFELLPMKKSTIIIQKLYPLSYCN